jgi:ATP-dependent exoDNAse (exonuclease V) alpha subunit
VTIRITEEFSDVLTRAQAGESLLIVGGAGTGKTTLLHLIRSALEAQGKSVVVVAPTGAAALNARGSTIHKTFGFRANVHLSSNSFVPSRAVQEVLKGLDVLIIDEFSMVSSIMLDQMARLLRIYNDGRTASSRQLSDFARAFGYAQVILIGDPFQLAPTMAEAEVAYIRDLGWESQWWLSAKHYTTNGLSHVQLSEHFRQDEHEFVATLNAMRHLSATQEHFEWVNQRYVANDTNFSLGEATYLVATNQQQESRNELELRKLDTPLRQHEAVIEYRDASAKVEIPDSIPKSLSFKVGARVMMTVNVYEPGGRPLWVNGSTGVIESIEPERGAVSHLYVRLHSGELVVVTPHAFEMYQARLVEEVTKQRTIVKRVRQQHVASILQFPFVLGWASTIHKAQGKTLDKVAIDLSRPTFSPGHLYVGLSRCRRFEDLAIIGTPVAPDHLFATHPLVTEYYNEHFPID